VAPTPVGKASSAARCPWILKVETVQGRTLLTAAAGKNVQYRLSCEYLNVQAPNGSIEAQGTVKLSGVGMEVICDRLTISWQNDQVILEGHAQMTYRSAGQDLELAADRLSVRLTGARTDHEMQPETREPPAVGSSRERPAGTW
jgi:hypothetical protein